MGDVVRAIDVGYSWTKYVTVGDTASEIRCRAFPSLAPRASSRDLALDSRARRQTVQVPVDELLFEVGPEAALVQETFHAIPLDDGYTDSPEYLALVRGALRLMRVGHVDLLVVGLPVALFRQRRLSLERRLTGDHPVGEGAAVTVKSVKALAQPVGALLSAAIENEALRHLRNARNLIVDVGWRTFDWVVTSGGRILDKRTDSVPKSMFDVVDAIARTISRELGAQLSAFDYARIDAGLRNHEPVRFFGKPLELGPYLALGQRVADETVTAMRRLVQEGTDIDNVVLGGGGAGFFRDAIARAYPKHALTELPEPFFANCRGFQIAGLEYAASDRRRDRADPVSVDG
jgi:plasmid segregation protein ParM